MVFTHTMYVNSRSNNGDSHDGVIHPASCVDEGDETFVLSCLLDNRKVFFWQIKEAARLQH